MKNRPQQRAQKREVRVCYHQGAIFGGLVAPVLAFFAVNFNLGYAVPMLVGTVVAAASVVISLLLSPEIKGDSSRRRTPGRLTRPLPNPGSP